MDTPSAQDRSHLHEATNTRTLYRIDPAASRVEFTIGKRFFFVTHLMVTGRFRLGALEQVHEDVVAVVLQQGVQVDHDHYVRRQRELPQRGGRDDTGGKPGGQGGEPAEQRVGVGPRPG
jgi:hypothetical protein